MCADMCVCVPTGVQGEVAAHGDGGRGVPGPHRAPLGAPPCHLHLRRALHGTPATRARGVSTHTRSAASMPAANTRCCCCVCCGTRAIAVHCRMHRWWRCWQPTRTRAPPPPAAQPRVGRGGRALRQGRWWPSWNVSRLDLAGSSGSGPSRWRVPQPMGLQRAPSSTGARAMRRCVRFCP